MILIIKKSILISWVIDKDYEEIIDKMFVSDSRCEMKTYENWIDFETEINDSPSKNLTDDCNEPEYFVAETLNFKVIFLP